MAQRRLCCVDRCGKVGCTLKIRGFLESNPSSDTVASTMTYLLYRLALHPEHAVRIREELGSISSIHDSRALKFLPHLNGAINEVLRLHPSVPTGGYRESPPEGIQIAGTWIPGNITIVAPRYTLGRRESNSISSLNRY